MRRRTGSRFFLAAVLFLFLAAASADGLTAYAPSGHFLLRHDGYKPYSAKLTAEFAEEELRRVAEMLDYDISHARPFKLTVYTNHYDFMESAASSGFDRYTVGLAKSGDQSVSVDASGSIVSVREVLSHEITHAILFRKHENRDLFPLWFHEGLAKYISEGEGGIVRDKHTVAENDGEILSLTTLRNRFPQKKINLAYAESAFAVRKMIDEGAKRGVTVGEIVNTAAKESDFDAGCEAATGMNQEKFEDNFTGAFAKEYASLSVDNMAATAIGIVMAVLLIAAFIVRMKAKKRAVMLWEAEDFINNEYPGVGLCTDPPKYERFRIDGRY
ncbi:MAG: hypothetical protein J6332_06405 [Abditibacteriota bacterium]|nr:hypothetical protein [Abditibacteriota bacterium]